jgi:hypothetical protein
MATAQTLQQWHDKLKKWVPGWWFQNQYNMSVAVTDAVFFAAAAVFQQAEQDMLDQQAATFYTASPGPIIDLLGDERGLKRLAGQSDAAYDVSVQNCLFRNVGQVVIQAQINAQLNNGAAFFIENEQYGFYDDADVTQTNGIPYFDDYWTRFIPRTKTYNFWTAIIPLQTAGTQATIMTNIVAAIEANKALGTSYDILYESASDTDSDD